MDDEVEVVPPVDDEAEDVLQEAYLRAFAAIGRFRGEASLFTWLTRITLNEARGRLRKRRPSVAMETLEAAQESGAALVAFRNETRRALDKIREVEDVVFQLDDGSRVATVDTSTKSGPKRSKKG